MIIIPILLLFRIHDPIIGEIYISVDRVKENAVLFDVTQNHELLRVMVHGLLHLCGYDDQNKKAKKLMTEKEDFILAEIIKING